ncbi:SulP family inorganic anion transporter [Clostridium grantii]|uniref:Sulfate permease, SulP family n=1 Tax=Clostridium grantii DSM 8605 TaxID=1121316 RepID=A0A1M5WFQ5_9CLOT|nr:sulfate permease [Clostridium grantii]SHH86267.1 sulfate permease, SulP family [Clostridium grantii DSM 8605]
MKPKLFSIIKHREVELTKHQLGNDIIAGIIVAIIALPLSVALAIASGVTPEKGLITAIIAGFLISFLGGSRVQIGGPTGAFVIIVYGIVAQYGVAGLTVATLMAGSFMVFFGLMRFGGIIKYVPYPTTTGFTSGIAIVLLSTQIKDFFGLAIDNVPSEFFGKWKMYIDNISSIDVTTAIVGIISILIIVLWPKIDKRIPGSLVALVIVTVAVKILNLPVDTIGSRFGDISNTIKFVNFKDLDISIPMMKELIRPAITIAFLASIESLLSAVVADGMIGKKHNSNMELIAQGIANIFSALFGGIPATGAIARTAANVKNGGRTPIAGMVHAIVLLLIMILFMPLAKLIPMTTLSAILIIVAYNMSEWRSFKALLKSTKSDIAVLLVTFMLTITFDLVIAIEIGMIIAMFLFVRRMSESTQISNINHYYDNLFYEEDDDDELNESINDGIHIGLKSKIMVYEINGPLFFGAANTFLEIMNEVKNNTNVLILKMKNVPNMDATAFNALRRIEKRCSNEKITLLFTELNEQPLKLLRVSGFVEKIGENSFFDTVEKAVEYADELVIN